MDTLAKVKESLKENYISRMMGEIVGLLSNMVNSIEEGEMDVKQAIEQTIKENPNEAKSLKKTEKAIEYEEQSRAKEVESQLTSEMELDKDEFNKIPNRLEDINAVVSEQQAQKEIAKAEKEENQKTREEKD